MTAAICLAALVAPAQARATECADADQPVEVVGVARLTVATACVLREARAERGGGPVVTDGKLAAAGRTQARDMVEQGYFDHVGPDGRVLQTRLRAAGWIPKRGSWTAGEILAYGTGELGTAAALVDGWVHSAGHEAILEDPQFDRMGVALVAGIPDDATDGVTAVAEFGRRTRA